MDLMNGNDGPTMVVTKKFYCTNCKWVIKQIGYISACVNDDVDWLYKPFGNRLSDSLETPFWCPYLLKKMRREKLNELGEVSKNEGG